ncbi:EFR1 family ferrodoxin [Methanoregula sp.]|uniref:EFR1 family ferrodoxin n=1 Tax=Methanoregula sp. TaxID=2052170 RepID=UPI003C72F4BE
MKANIYYFSGTGNSLAVARDLAKCLDEAVLIPIPLVMHQMEITDNAQIVGIVFPVYFSDMPRYVREFVKKLRFSATPYIFGIASCGNGPGHSLFTLRSLLEKKGTTLAAGFLMVMPENYIAPFDLIEPASVQQQKNKDAKEKIPALAAAISRRQVSVPEGTGSLVWRILIGIFSVYTTSVIRIPNQIHATDACNRCGVCGRICPTNNITVTEKAVTWDGRCTQCYACVHWCPRGAIEIGSYTAGKPRYHHPDIVLKDMILR